MTQFLSVAAILLLEMKQWCAIAKNNNDSYLLDRFFSRMFPSKVIYHSFAVAYSSVYLCVFSTADAPWTVLLANIEPESTGVTVGGLIPARSYQFRLCAVNDVGRGQFSKETDRWVSCIY